MKRPRWQKVLTDLRGNLGRTALVIASIAVGLFAFGVASGLMMIPVAGTFSANEGAPRRTLAAYTIAPFDDAGGHINPYNGYHYHAVTGHTKEIKQPDGHAPLIGYIMDGYGLYAHSNEDGSVPNDLDECGGHSDDIRGYHYHASAAADNQIIKAFRGVPGTMTTN